MFLCVVYGCSGSRSGSGYPVNFVNPGRIQIQPDPVYLDPAGSVVGLGKYWPDVHNYDIKHHSIFFIPGNDV